MLERRYNGRCRYGNGWGFDRSRIWVSHGCRARFAYGIGGYHPRYHADDGDAALIIGGVAVAAGLVAILSRSGRKHDSLPPQSIARIVANYNGVRASAQPGLRQCMDKAASNVAATGGTRIELGDVTIDSLSHDTYRYDVDIRAAYPDQNRRLAFSCTATADSVEEFDFITDE